MKAKKMVQVLSMIVLGLLFVSCAGRLNYNEVAPNAERFKPKNVVVLPVKMPEGLDLEAETAGQVITDAVTKTRQFDNVIDPATARSQMASNNELQDAVVAYLSKLWTVGVSVKAVSKKRGEIYHSDTFIVTDVSRWGYMRYGGESYAEVSISIKMVDAATGTVIWKAGHTQQQPYSIVKPKLAAMSRQLTAFIFRFMPRGTSVQNKG
ncbi:MAG: hypothetical protein Q7T83_00035 [Thermodesulfovibrionales bacterium]|nr:hypothetical protein [Thermodesulfovibrionales bacterium]MDP3112587.1 hypothetical protein [Thermodesulfovibrionales bacterium]